MNIIRKDEFFSSLRSMALTETYDTITVDTYSHRQHPRTTTATQEIEEYKKNRSMAQKVQDSKKRAKHRELRKARRK